MSLDVVQSSVGWASHRRALRALAKTEGASSAPGTAGVPSFGSNAGHSSSGRTESPRTPTAGPPPPTVEETAYDESHESTFNYGHFAGGSSAWTNHMAEAYAGKGADRVDPSKTMRLTWINTIRFAPVVEMSVVPRM